MDNKKSKSGVETLVELQKKWRGVLPVFRKIFFGSFFDYLIVDIGSSPEEERSLQFKYWLLSNDEPLNALMLTRGKRLPTISEGVQRAGMPGFPWTADLKKESRLWREQIAGSELFHTHLPVYIVGCHYDECFGGCTPGVTYAVPRKIIAGQLAHWDRQLDLGVRYAFTSSQATLMLPGPRNEICFISEADSDDPFWYGEEFFTSVEKAKVLQRGLTILLTIAHDERVQALDQFANWHALIPAASTRNNS